MSNHQSHAVPHALRVLAMPLDVRLLSMDMGVDLYLRNPFRFLAAGAGIDDAGREAIAQRLRSLYKLKPQAAARKAVALGYGEGYDGHDLLDAINALREPRQRLIWELFWPHLPQEAFAAANGGNGLAALADAAEREAGVAGEHALAVIAHNRALAAELGNGAPPAGADELWTRALGRWRELLAGDGFWQHLAERIERLDDPRLREDDLADLRDGLPRALLAMNATLARAYAQAGEKQQAGRHLRLIAASGFPSALVSTATGGMVRALASSELAGLVERAEQALEGADRAVRWSRVAAWCSPLLDAAERLVADLQASGASAEALEQVQFDDLADKLLGAVNQRIDYEQDRQRALLYSALTAQRLAGMPLSGSMRRRAQESAGKDREYLYGRFYDRPRQAAEENDPTRCWFVPDEPADPAASLLLPVYRIEESSRPDAVSWSHGAVLVPRSKLAEGYHDGKVKKRELLARKGKGASLAREIEALEARLARERGEMEAQRDAEVAQARRPEQERLDAYEAEVMQEEATLRKLLATLEQTYGERAKEVKARLDGALEQTRARWRGPLQEAERAARRSRPLRRWFGVYLPVAALLAAGGAWLATLAPLRQGLLAALADLELLLRSRFLTPDSLIDLLPQTTAAASLLPLALLASRMLLGRGDRGAAAEFARLRDEHGREVLASRQAADERLAAIARERDTRRAEPQARIDAIEARRAAHRSARDAAGEAVKRRHDARIDSHVRGLQAQIEERQRRLDAFQVGLRNLSAQRDFPAYKTAKRRGYQDGEKPSSAERERVAQRQVEAFLRLLSDSDRQILAMLANRLSEEQMGKVYELLNQAGSSGARSVILRALVRDF